MNNRLNLQAATIYERAAAYIRKYGWHVSGMSRHGYARCSMGALSSAYSAKTWHPSLAEIMYEELYKELNGISLTQFNYKYKDGEKVAELFEKVAKKIRHKYSALTV